MTVLEMTRLERGWSQEKLGEESGLSNFTISRIETGKSKPSKMSLMRLGEALDVPLDQRLKLGADYGATPGTPEWLS